MSSPYDVARPSEGAGKSKETVTFWAELWRPMDGNSHGEALISPKFGTEPEMVGWVRTRRTDWAQVATWRRVSHGSTDFDDQRLATDPDLEPDPARLADLFSQMAGTIAAAKPGPKPFLRLRGGSNG